MDKEFDGQRRPPFPEPIFAGSQPDSGVVIVDLDRSKEAMQAAIWLKSRGHSPVIAPLYGMVVEDLVVPIVGIFTERTEGLERVRAEYPEALLVVVVDNPAEAFVADRTANYVLMRPLNFDGGTATLRAGTGR